MKRFDTDTPILQQLAARDLEFDQKLGAALKASASQPDLSPEDVGFPDSYLTLALYRLNTALTSVVTLDEKRLNLFHEYKLAGRCEPTSVRPGRRLCAVLDRAASLVGDGKTLGAGHFLRAVIDLSLNEPAEDLQWLGFPGQVQHQTFSIETLMWGMGHTAWTPVDSAPEVRRILAALERHDPVEDVDYLLTSENGRIVFRPATLLDSFGMEHVPGQVRPGVAALTHFRHRFGCISPDEILELEDLVNSARATESDFQRFFEGHPHFLRVWDHRDVHPHVYLSREEDGPLVPDFILTDPEMQRATIVDLKLPGAKIVRRQRNRDRFANAIMEARAQLQEYQSWFEDPAKRQAMKDRFGMEVYRPRLGVVIGRGDAFRGAADRQKLSSSLNDLEIATYDDVLTLAKRRLAIIDRA